MVTTVWLCHQLLIVLVSLPSSHPPITSHPETMLITIHSDDVGFGINLKGEQNDPYIVDSVLVVQRCHSIYRHVYCRRGY